MEYKKNMLFLSLSSRIIIIIKLKKKQIDADEESTENKA